jgi:uncharacterized protein with HEPN domain
MTRHDDIVRLRHMLEHAQEAVQLANGKGRGDLDADRLLELGLTRLLEIIGEAANLVSEETQERYPQLPWRQMIGLRNRLIHGYDEVDLDILWDILQLDLPPLIAALERIGEEEAPASRLDA